MLYVNEGYENYKYIVSVSDNYIILTDRKNVTADWTNPVDIPIIYQYFIPSNCTIETTRTVSSNQSYSTVDISTDYWDRADCSLISTCIFFLILLFIVICNSITEFVEKGGIFK